MRISNTRGASCIRPRALKFQAPRSLSPHLANFHPCALSRSSIPLETIMLLPPHAVLNLGPRARHLLVPSPGARRRVDLGLGAHRHHPLPQAVCAPLLVIVALPPSTSTPSPSECAVTVDLNPAPSERATTVLFLKP
jgi:hypothetical protein